MDCDTALAVRSVRSRVHVLSWCIEMALRCMGSTADNADEWLCWLAGTCWVECCPHAKRTHDYKRNLLDVFLVFECVYAVPPGTGVVPLAVPAPKQCVYTQRVHPDEAMFDSGPGQLHRIYHHEERCVVQGDCSKAPSEQILEGLDPGLIQLKPMQCVILTNTRFMEVRPSSNIDVTLDNLYVRVQKYAVDETSVPLLVFSTASVWISNTTLQGDRGQHTAITTNKNAALHVSGTLSTGCSDVTPEHALSGLRGSDHPQCSPRLWPLTRHASNGGG